jgi:hypothetical protein
MPLNRIVALVTPIAALAAGACATWLTQHFPGIEIKESDLQSVFIAGAVVVLAPAAQWLHGWQKHEARQADTDNAIKLGLTTMPVAAETAESRAVAPDDLSDIDDLAAIDGLEDDASSFDDFGDEVFDEGNELIQTTD